MLHKIIDIYTTKRHHALLDRHQLVPKHFKLLLILELDEIDFARKAAVSICFEHKNKLRV